MNNKVTQNINTISKSLLTQEEIVEISELLIQAVELDKACIDDTLCNQTPYNDYEKYYKTDSINSNKFYTNKEIDHLRSVNDKPTFHNIRYRYIPWLVVPRPNQQT